MKYLVLLLFLTLFLGACENTRHSIGLTGKPLASDGKFEDTLKFQYKIIFGKIRSKKSEDDDD